VHQDLKGVVGPLGQGQAPDFLGVTIDLAAFIGLCLLGPTQVGQLLLSTLVNRTLFLGTSRRQFRGGALILDP
jgi:hypothetical protein